MRVLRALIVHGGELAPPEIARRAHMTPQGTRQVLGSLVKVGIVVEIGLGRYKQYQVRAVDPLLPALEALFDSEARRYKAVLDAIRTSAASIVPPPRAVWLYGSAARGEDGVDSDVDLAVLVEVEPVERAVERFREAVEDATAHFGLRLSIVGLGPDDVARLAEGDAWWNGVRRDAWTVVGPDPDTYVRQMGRRARGAKA
ncbi:MAG TPA: nucleotidyltransferase domain-containing protein [Longimicrobiales bacterium]|nr:nucleotidyltransferase domain-containing protein [Longimicrobiales bacterium]